MQISVELTTPRYESFRVRQVEGLFDMPPAEQDAVRFSAEIPRAGDPWSIGLIIGPSGSGKTSLARAAFGKNLVERIDWPEDRAVIDAFDHLPTREITSLLTAVGFGSPPGWLKPYRVLSGGERFRCDLARALSCGVAASRDEPAPIVAFDEFTSVVDRQVAQLGSAAVARALRGGRLHCRFVGVTCHYDVEPWLAPDWTLDLSDGRLHRRCLRRPAIELEVARCRPRAWSLFARHHYLSGELSCAARCYWACWRGVPVAFCATLPLIGRRGRWRITRLVTLPDFQGLGIGTRLARGVAEIHREEGHRTSITTSHPGLIRHMQSAADWRATGFKKQGTKKWRGDPKQYCGSHGRALASFEYKQSAAGR